MKKERLILIDNTKGILIALTVLGHLLSQCLGKYLSTDVAYVFIYLFHMPAFCLLSGFLSKNLDKDRKNCFRNLIIPYIVIYVAWYLYYAFVWDKNPTFNLFMPGYAQWYLLSLITWKLISKTFTKIKYPIIISIIIALAVGFIDGIGADYSLSRTIVFYPFFLIGHYLTKEHIEKIRTFNIGYAITGLILVLIGAYLYKTNAYPLSMLYARASYELSYATLIEGFLLRIGIYIAALIATFSLIKLIPNKKTIFTNIGVNSLLVLVLHVYIIRYFTYTNLYDSFNYIETILFIICSCPIIVFITSLNIFKIGFDFIIKNVNLVIDTIINILKKPFKKKLQ